MGDRDRELAPVLVPAVPRTPAEASTHARAASARCSACPRCHSMMGTGTSNRETAVSEADKDSHVSTAAYTAQHWRPLAIDDPDSTLQWPSPREVSQGRTRQDTGNGRCCDRGQRQQLGLRPGLALGYGKDGTCCLHSAAAIFAAATSSLSSELTSVLERRRIERRGLLAASSSLALGCTAAEAPDACVFSNGFRAPRCWRENKPSRVRWL